MGFECTRVLTEADKAAEAREGTKLFGLLLSWMIGIAVVLLPVAFSGLPLLPAAFNIYGIYFAVSSQLYFTLLIWLPSLLITIPIASFAPSTILAVLLTPLWLLLDLITLILVIWFDLSLGPIDMSKINIFC